MVKMGKLRRGGKAAPIEVALTAPRCAARRKYDGKPCQGPAMANGRCRLHGGLSTGPKTEEGRRRIAKAQWKHGYYSKESVEKRREWKKAREAAGLPRYVRYGGWTPRPL